MTRLLRSPVLASVDRPGARGTALRRGRDRSEGGVRRLDAAANVQWTWQQPDASGYTLAAHATGNTVVAGWDIPGKGAVWKLDPSGQTLWKRPQPTPTPFAFAWSTVDIGWRWEDIAALPSGAPVVVGWGRPGPEATGIVRIIDGP